MKRLIGPFAAPFAMAALFGAAPADAENLAGAIAKAYETNPSLISARAALRAQDESVPQARAGMRPTVTGSASVSQTFSSTEGAQRQDQPLNLGVRATQTLFDGGRTFHAVEGAEKDVAADRARLIDTEQSVILAVITAYSNVRRDVQFVRLAEANVRLIAEQLRAAQDRFEVGEVTRTDVSQAEARLAQSRSNLAANEGALARSRQAYRRVVGEIPDALDPTPPLPDVPATLDIAIQNAMDAHPLIVAARFDEDSARSGVKTALSGFLPTVTLDGQVNLANQENGLRDSQATFSSSVALNATIPLYQAGAQSSRVRQAQAFANQRRADLSVTTRGIYEAVENAFSDLDVARIAIRATRQQVSAASLAYDGVKEEAKVGARTTLDVLDAEQELLNARSDLISALRDEYVAAFTLLSAMGMLTVSDLGLDVNQYDPTLNYDAVNDRYYGYDSDENTVWESDFRP